MNRKVTFGSKENATKSLMLRRIQESGLEKASSATSSFRPKRNPALVPSGSNARFLQALLDISVVIKLDSGAMLQMVRACPGDIMLIEQPQRHLTRNGAKLIRLLVDKLDVESGSEQRVALLAELFLSECRELKRCIVHVVKDTLAAVQNHTLVDNLQESHAKLANVVDRIVRNVDVYRSRLRKRGENIKAGVLRQTKHLMQRLREMHDAAHASQTALDVSAQQVSEELLFFLEIAEAAVMDDEAAMLRSAVSDALTCARLVLRKVRDNMPAADLAADKKALKDALDVAVSSVRQVVYSVLSDVQVSNGQLDDVAPSPRLGSSMNNTSLRANKSPGRRSSMFALHENEDDDDDSSSDVASVSEGFAAARQAYGIVQRPDDAEKLSRVDALPVELEAAMLQSLVKDDERYRRERSSTSPTARAVLLEKSNTAVGFYRKHFLTPDGPKPHVNFIASLKDKWHGPYAVISIRQTPELTTKSSEADQHLAIVRTKVSDELVFVGCAGQRDKDLQKGLRDGVAYLNKGDFTLVRNPEFVSELTAFEDKNLLRSYKFGVLVLSKDNVSGAEAGLYGHRGEHPGVTEFLSCMAHRVKLRGWPHYKGGLDTKSDTTGTHSWYSVFKGTEVMFHVAHEIPYTENDEQQVERKRHIGNDIVVLVFRERGAPPFDPDVIKSHFNHIFLVVTPLKTVSHTPHYHIEMLSNTSLREYGPALQSPPIYRRSQAFGAMLLAKMINGERAAYASPTFSQKFKRTKRELLEMMATSFGQI